MAGKVMKINEVKTAFEIHKVIEYGTDGNKIVRHNRSMRKVKDSIYFGEIYSDGYRNCVCVYLFYTEIDIGILIDRITDYGDDIDEYLERVQKGGYNTPEEVISTLDMCVEKGIFIRDNMIELAAYIKPENVTKYRQSKAEVLRQRDIRDAEKKAQKEQEEKEYIENQNRIADEKIKNAIDIIKNGGKLINHNVDIYNSRYDCSSYSIVNYLMRKYGIKTPLRTQGWINDKLLNAEIKDGYCGACQYQRIKNGVCSQTFFDYMNQLIVKVCEAE